MSGVRHNMYYIAGRIEDEQQICDIRDALYNRLNSGFDNYTKRVPHLTLINRIKLPVHHEHTIDTELDEFNPSGIPVTITGFSIWPSIDNPRYIALDVEAPIQSYQDTLTDIIDEYNGDILTEPPNPHITLFKCDDPQNVSHQFKQQLRQLQNQQFRFYTYIPYIDLLDSSLDEPTKQKQKVFQMASD